MSDSERVKYPRVSGGVAKLSGGGVVRYMKILVGCAPRVGLGLNE